MRYVKPFSLYRNLIKLDSLKQGRLLGLSVGADSIWDECVGVAVSNPSNERAEPYRVFEIIESNISKMASDIQDLMTNHAVSGIVVGLPNDGLLNDRRDVQEFVDNLSETGKLESVLYTYWEEEDLYSKRIQSMENPFFFDPIAAKKLSDKKMAAGGMLQDYLDAMKKHLLY